MLEVRIKIQTISTQNKSSLSYMCFNECHSYFRDIMLMPLQEWFKLIKVRGNMPKKKTKKINIHLLHIVNSKM